MEFRDDAGRALRKRALHGATPGCARTPAVEALGDDGDVQFAAAAEAETELVLAGEFAEEDCRLNPGDADEVIGDAFAVFHAGSGALHLFESDVAPGDAAFDLKVGEGDAEETDLADGIAEVDGAGDVVGVDAAENELLGHAKGGGAGAGIGEGAGVREDGGA